MFESIKASIQNVLQDIKGAGLYKDERIITTPQGAHISSSVSSTRV
jgi:glycine C-acetyltransferase